MSAQRRYDGYYDMYPGSTPAQDPQYTSRRNGEWKYRNSSQDARLEAPTHYLAPTTYGISSTATSTRKPTHSATRPPSRTTATRPPHSTSSNMQPVPTPYPQHQDRSQPPRRQPEAPELRDLRSHLNKRSAAPTPKSSFEQISGLEDNTKNSRQPRSRSSVRPHTAVPPVQPAPAVWYPPGPVQSDSSRMRVGNEEPKWDRHRERSSSRPARYRGDNEVEERDKERAREKDKAADRDKVKDRDRPRERERYTERPEEIDRERRQQGEYRRVSRPSLDAGKYVDRRETDKERRLQPDYRRLSKPSLPPRELPDSRADDHDSSDSVRQKHAASSGHRRYRSDEVTYSTPVVRLPLI
jgi:hypothetical protein